MTRNTKRNLKLAIVGGACAAGIALVVCEPLIRPADLPDAMSPAAPQRCIAIFLVCVALWFTNLIPLAATGLLALALLPLLGVLPERQAFALFGNDAVFFMLGVFLLAAATIATGLSKRMTLLALHRFDASPSRLVTGVTISAAALAMCMPAHAVAAMIYPILVEVVDALGLKRGARYAKKLFLALAWGAIVGGVGTLLGGARAPLALGLLHDAYPDERIGFVGWMIAALPVVLIMIVVAVLALRFRIPNDIDDIKPATNMLRARVRRLGPMSGAERRLTLLGIATIAAWITTSWHGVGLAVVGVVAASLLFVFRIVDWRSLQGYVNWGVLIMYGGAIALGKALAQTHALEWVARQVVGPTMPAFAVVVLMSIMALVLTECISNAAAVAVLLPIGFSLGDMTGVSPTMMTLAVTIPAGLAFLLPISTPPNAISFAAGHYSVREVLQLGWPMSVASLIVLLGVMAVWWHLVLNINAW
ncbi:MAG: SLC13 family permease [Phycisphaerae bacterium]